MQKTTISFLLLLLLLVSCNNKDEEIAPVDIVATTPELQEIQSKSENLENEIKKKIEETKEEVRKEIKKEMEAAATEAEEKIQEQVAEAQRKAEERIQIEIEAAQQKAEEKLKAELEKIQAEAEKKIKKQIEEAQAGVEEKIREEIAAGQADAEQRIKDEIAKAQAEATERIKKEIAAAQMSAKAQFLSEQREVSLELMKNANIADTKKFKFAMKYFALMDFQIKNSTNNHDFDSIQLFLEDTKNMFPKLDYINVNTNDGPFYPSHVKIKSDSFKYLLEDKKDYDLFALSIAMDVIFPESVNPDKSFYSILKAGLNSQVNSFSAGKAANVEELIMRNADKFVFLLQMRSNALINAVINSLDETPFSWRSKYTVTGEGMTLEEVEILIEMLKKSNKTREDLHYLGINVIDYRGRIDKLKAMKLRLSSNIDEDLRQALMQLERTIKNI
jgi:hypothetical protein